jgi:nitrogen-specific signal transduction histidine kinase
MLREQAARTEAEAVSRAKDRFLATVSHELRTPLTPVLVAVTAMLDEAAASTPFRSELEMIRRNLSLEARLVDDLLDLAQIRSGKLHLERETVDAHALVHHVIEICRDELAMARVELVLDLRATRNHVHADPARLQQVLWNLIKNAIKFTPPGGIVTVRSRDLEDRRQGADHAALVLEVNDTGIGIDQELIPRIFDVFDQDAFSPARRLGGLGLGLLISRSIVEQHGGRLAAASDGQNLGAKFTVELPSVIAPETAARREGPLATDTHIPYPPLTILLVEDNADTLNYLRKILTLRGNNVHTASSLSLALQMASDLDFDVLVSDIELPDGTGLELMRTLRTSRTIAGIALSGFGSLEDIELSRSAGFAEHLTKPVDFRRLEKAIHEVAAGT